MAKTPRKQPEKWPQTIVAAAKLAGTTRQTFSEWIDKGAPDKTPKGYDLAAILDWHAANIGTDRSAGAGGEKKGDQARLLKAQADEREAKAAHADLRLAIDRGDYIPIAEVKDRDIARVAMVKRGLFSLDRSLPPRLVGLQEKEMQVVIRKQVRELCERFARM